MFLVRHTIEHLGYELIDCAVISVQACQVLGYGCRVTPLCRTGKRCHRTFVRNVLRIAQKEGCQRACRSVMRKPAAFQLVGSHLVQAHHQVAGHYRGRMVAHLVGGGNLLNLIATLPQDAHYVVNMLRGTFYRKERMRQFCERMGLRAHGKQWMR